MAYSLSNKYAKKIFVNGVDNSSSTYRRRRDPVFWGHSV